MAKKPTTRKQVKKSKPAHRQGQSKKTAKRTKVALKRTVTKQTYPQALKIYESGLASLHRKDFPVAQGQFQRLIDGFPEERELHERCRLYLEVIERKSKTTAVPKTIEEQILAATVALNTDAPREAIQYLELARKEAPDSNEVHYLLAVSRAADGDLDTALIHLRRAVELNADNRFLARHESSFEPLHEQESFQHLIGSVVSSPSGDSKTPSAELD